MLTFRDDRCICVSIFNANCSTQIEELYNAEMQKRTKNQYQEREWKHISAAWSYWVRTAVPERWVLLVVSAPASSGSTTCDTARHRLYLRQRQVCNSPFKELIRRHCQYYNKRYEHSVHLVQ